MAWGFEFDFIVLYLITGFDFTFPVLDHSMIVGSKEECETPEMRCFVFLYKGTLPTGLMSWLPK